MSLVSLQEAALLELPDLDYEHHPIPVTTEGYAGELPAEECFHTEGIPSYQPLMPAVAEVQISPSDAVQVDPLSFNETEVIARAQQGDEQAFTELYNKFYPYVRAVAYNNSNDRNAIEDIVQVTLTEVFNKIENFQKGNFKGWLATITERTIINLYRHNKRRVTIADEEPDFDRDMPRDEDANGMDQLVETTVLAQQLATHIRKLDPKFRQVFIDTEIVGMTDEECAEANDLKVGTVKSRRHRAKEKLAQLITAGEHVV